MDDMVIEQRRRDRDDVITAENAFIESVYTDNRTGYVTISYGIMGDFCMMHVQVVTLVVGNDTILLDQFGQPISLGDLREGMVVYAEFSSAMTRSIPPQARAFRIIVLDNNFAVTEDRVAYVDSVNNFLYTGNPNDINTQMRFVITDATIIKDRRGRLIRLRDLRPGDFVRVEHAVFQTASIPPQTTAFNVRVL